MIRFAYPAIAFVVALLVPDVAARATALDVSIRPVFDGEPLRLDSLRYTNAAGETLSVSRLSYLLSAFALERDTGGWVEIPGQYAWMDAAQQRTVVHLRRTPGRQIPSGALRCRARSRGQCGEPGEVPGRIIR